MDENEEKKTADTSESDGTGEREQTEELCEADASKSAVTEKGSGLPKTVVEPIRGLDADSNVSVRMRRPQIPFRMVGIAIAVVLLTVAVLLAVMAVEHAKKGSPSETTGENTAESESVTTSDETESPEKNLYAFDPAAIPEGAIGFRPMDLSGKTGTWENRSDRSFDTDALMTAFASAYPALDGAVAIDKSRPLVLILHTHTTEGYSADGAIAWDGTGEFARTQNGEESVLAVGKVLADHLTAAGIPALHCVVFHDIDENGTVTNAGSYDRACETISHYRALYPTIRYVIDLHRDVVFDESGYAIRPITAVGEDVCAQIQPVVGNGASAEATEQNLAFALQLAKSLNEKGALARPALLKDSPLHSGEAEFSLSFEIGSAANCLSEAKCAAKVLAESLSDWIFRIEAAKKAA